jgi:5-formyltetrahydrofolate cyclo-ligase
MRILYVHGSRGTLFLPSMNDPEHVSLKDTLRQEARRHRVRMDANIEDIEATVEHFFNSIKPAKGQVIAAYWPMGREFDPRPILERLLAEKFTCVLPVLQKDDRILKFSTWEEGAELVKNSVGAMEPTTGKFLDPDIVIVPLLAFDRRGYRLGQGGGYYDATLAFLRARKTIAAVGVAYAQQSCLFNLPVEAHDQKLDWVITPAGTHFFE